MDAITVSNALIGAIVDGAPLSAAARVSLLAEVGLADSAFRDVTGRTSLQVLAQLWGTLIERTGDNFIGVQIGQAIPGDRFGLAVFAALNSETFRQVLQRFCRYCRLINALMSCELAETPECATLTMKLEWNAFDLERHAADLFFVAVVTWARQHLGDRFQLRELQLKHSLRDGLDRYRSFFGVPVVLGAAHNQLRVEPAALDEPITDGNPELGRILEQHADRELDRIPQLQLPARVSQIIQQGLTAGTAVDLACVAGQLRTPPRQLQRQLRAALTSFSQLLDQARRELAPGLLRAHDANVEQVGFQLGYSEPTAFIRAFKKWYGMTPGEYRKQTP
jgi:AraC-like DNA-binding protein